MTNEPDLDELHDRVDDLMGDAPWLLVRVVDVEPAPDGTTLPGTAAARVMSCGMDSLQVMSVLAGLQVDLVQQLSARAHEEHAVRHLRDDLEQLERDGLQP